MKTIKASEIGNYVFCERAWKYRQKGREPENHKELAAGVKVHYQHNKKVLVSSIYRNLGLILLSAVIIGLMLIGAIAPSTTPL